MKKTILVLAICAAIAACGNNENSASDVPAGDSTPTITSGNDAATHSQVIPRDSVEMSSDSTGNIRPSDTTKK